MEIRHYFLLPLALLLASCNGEPVPEPAVPIEGSFVAANPWGSGQGFYMGLSLNAIGETVSGQGWLGGAGDPLVFLTIVGQFIDPDFALGVSAGATALGTISGTATVNGLTGTYQPTGGATPVVLVFVPQDSGAIGRYTGTTTGEFAGSLAAPAGFGVQDGTFSFRLAYPNRSDALLDLGRQGGRPELGTHQLGETTLPGTVVMGTDPNLRTFRVKSGQMRIDVSTPYALIGELLLQAEEDGTAAGVGLNILFSAGCMTRVCQ
ncbi:MAG TPA: hypothetical protein VJU15_02935 [Gemmatimonadales bacterium]|nr:hypothetical protein [Gemmatimonadales bacterium]